MNLKLNYKSDNDTHEAALSLAETSPAEASGLYRGLTVKTLSAPEKIAWVQLSRSENVGPITFFRLLSQFGGDIHQALESLPTLAARGGRKRLLKVYEKSRAEAELTAHEKSGTQLIAWCEPAYPALMRQIPDAPPLISARGKVDLLSRKSIAIVGARNASANGRRFAWQLANDLGAQDFVMASGMARGIDAAVHNGSLETGTIAVLGGGVDIVYPAENQQVYDEITQHGVLISEVPLGTQPMARHFPRRNRLISGLSEGVVVVEAALKSGSLITARLAGEYNRDVFAVPGSPLDSRCRGTNSLLKQGATLIESAQDVLDNLSHNRSSGQSFLNAAFEEPEPFEAAPLDLKGEATMGQAQEMILETLSATPTHVDDVIHQSELTASMVSAVLLDLELAGRVSRSAGNMISLTYNNENEEES